MNKLTKLQRYWLENYNKSTDNKLEDVYKRTSYEKTQAFERCKQKMLEVNGKGMKIISHNCHVFTCGYLIESDDKIELVVHLKDRTERFRIA